MVKRLEILSLRRIVLFARSCFMSSKYRCDMSTYVLLLSRQNDVIPLRFTGTVQKDTTRRKDVASLFAATTQTFLDDDVPTNDTPQRCAT